MARFGRWPLAWRKIWAVSILTLRYSLLLSVWVDPSAEHILIFVSFLLQTVAMNAALT